MLKTVGTGIFLTLLIFCNFLYADKPLERVANELGVQGEELYNSGKYFEAAESFYEAVDKYQEAVEKDGIPEDRNKIDTWYYYAYQAYLNTENFEKALEPLDERIKLDPGNYDLYKEKGIIYNKYLRRTENAITVLVDYDRKYSNLKARKKIAKYYTDLKDFESAIIWYNKALEIKSDDAAVIKNIATLNVELGRDKNAIKAYQDFLETNPKESVLIKTYKNMGALYEKLENTQKSIEYFEKSLNLKFDSKVGLKLITKYYDVGFYDDAMDKIELVLAKKPSNKDALYFKAMINYENGEMAIARSDFSRLVNDTKYGKSAQGFIKSIDSQ